MGWKSVNKCNLWKVQLTLEYGDTGMYPTDPDTPVVFWAYNFNETKARNAAIKWAATEYTFAEIHIKQVDLIK